MKKVWRVFVSSTFEDFRLERAILQKYVFPEIKEEAIKKGVEFLPIDLRWGVPNEAQIDQRTMDICLGEVERATTEPHPDFLLLTGDRYGWVPLPRVIEKEEFEKIINRLKELNENTNILEEWYELDENQLPTSYILKSRDEVTDKDYKEWENWEKAENEIRGLLQSAVNKLDFDKEKKEKYFISATHQEFRTFLNHSGKDNIQNHIFAIMRKFENKDEINDKKLVEDTSELKNFKDEIKKNLKKGNICETSVSAEIYKKVDEIEKLIEESENFNEFIKKLNDDEIKKYFIKSNKFVKDKLLQSVQNYNFNELGEEELQEDFLNHLFNRPFKGRDKEIKEVYEKIKKGEDILMIGEGGVGKSAFMASLIKKVKKDHKKVKYFFVGATQNSILCDDIVKFIENVEDNGIVFIDAFDQIKFDENCNINKFFDVIRNKNAQFILSVIPIKEIGDYFEKTLKSWISKNFEKALEKEGYSEKEIYNYLYVYPENESEKIPEKVNEIYDSVLKDFEKEYLKIIEFKKYKLVPIGNKDKLKLILEELLEKENRTLTDEQYEYVLNKDDSGKPLYLTMAKEEVKFWRSSDELTDKKEEENKKTRYLPKTQKEMIKEFIKNLSELHHNKEELVKKVFGYIVASDYTLSEEKLLEVLSLDDELMKEIQNTHHNNLTKTIPPAVWARLRFHIKDILIEDENGNLKFFHREFDDIAKEMFFNCETLCQFEKTVAKVIEKGKLGYLIQFLIVSMLKGFKNKRKKECLLNEKIAKEIVEKVKKGECNFKNELKLFEKKLFKDLRKFFRTDADYVMEVEVLFLLNWIKFYCNDEEINKIIDECNKTYYPSFIQNRENLKNIDYSLFEKELSEDEALELVRKSFVSYNFLKDKSKTLKMIETNSLVLVYEEFNIIRNMLLENENDEIKRNYIEFVLVEYIKKFPLLACFIPNDIFNVVKRYKFENLDLECLWESLENPEDYYESLMYCRNMSKLHNTVIELGACENMLLSSLFQNGKLFDKAWWKEILIFLTDSGDYFKVVNRLLEQSKIFKWDKQLRNVFNEINVEDIFNNKMNESIIDRKLRKVEKITEKEYKLIVLKFKELYKRLKNKFNEEEYSDFLSLYEDLVFFIGEKDTKMLDKCSKSFFEIFFYFNKNKNLYKKELAKSIYPLEKIKQFLLQKNLSNTETYKILNFLIKN